MDSDYDFRIGQTIVIKACYEPFSQILRNAGYEEEQISELIITLLNEREREITIMEKLMFWKTPNLVIDTRYDKWSGYNLKTEQIVDMAKAGIIDPFKVVKSALVNSSSVAGTILTTNNLVYEIREKEQQQIPQMY